MTGIDELSAPAALRIMLKNLAQHAPDLRLRGCVTGLDGTTHLASCPHSPIIIESRGRTAGQLTGARFQNCCVTFLGDLTEGPAARDLVEQVHILSRLEFPFACVADLHSALAVAPVLTRAAKARAGYYCALPMHPALESWWSTVRTQEDKLLDDLAEMASILASDLGAPESPDPLVLMSFRVSAHAHMPVADHSTAPLARLDLARLLFLEDVPAPSTPSSLEYVLGPRWTLDLVRPSAGGEIDFAYLDDPALLETTVTLHGGDAFPTLAEAVAAARAL